jgi:hypothetical protein
MRVSEHYQLGRTQATLDFVDIDITNDLQVFISPRALRLSTSEWGRRCVSLVQNFFDAVLQLIRNGQHNQAEALLRALSEPNETHLGLSRDRSQGRAVGSGSAHDIWAALNSSEAVRTGLLEDLEETVLMVPGISSDIVSDITTNIIRQPLIEYTQHVSQYYGIPLITNVDPGPLWNSQQRQWFTEFVSLPIADGNKLLLVPKDIVRLRMTYDVHEYYRHYLLERLQNEELTANSELVEVLKNGKRRVTKKSLIRKYGQTKEAIVQQTLRFPRELDRYRAQKEKQPNLPLSHEQISDLEQTERPNWDELLHNVTSVPTGVEHAAAYENAVEALLSALFFPVLSNPQKQTRLHQGRKRIDLTYNNMALQGFFKWLAAHYSSAQIFVECKNYRSDIGNEELDQLSGRFGPSRGTVGISVSRSFQTLTTVISPNSFQLEKRASIFFSYRCYSAGLMSLSGSPETRSNQSITRTQRTL